MATVHDVVAFILRRHGPTTAMKLQKLLYYSQAWSLVWDGKPLFKARIEAWAHGPVIREVWRYHRGVYMLREWKHSNADPKALTDSEADTVNSVLAFYGDKSPQWLSDLTHMEAPWQEARRGTAPGELGGKEISLASMEAYYSSIAPAR